MKIMISLILAATLATLALLMIQRRDEKRTAAKAEREQLTARAVNAARAETLARLAAESAAYDEAARQRRLQADEARAEIEHAAAVRAVLAR